jgi:hypothetical protein
LFLANRLALDHVVGRRAVRISRLLTLAYIGCGFGAVGILRGYYPTGIAAVFALLLTYC